MIVRVQQRDGFSARRLRLSSYGVDDEVPEEAAGVVTSMMTPGTTPHMIAVGFITGMAVWTATRVIDSWLKKGGR